MKWGPWILWTHQVQCWRKIAEPKVSVSDDLGMRQSIVFLQNRRCPETSQTQQNNKSKIPVRSLQILNDSTHCFVCLFVFRKILHSAPLTKKTKTKNNHKITFFFPNGGQIPIMWQSDQIYVSTMWSSTNTHTLLGKLTPAHRHHLSVFLMHTHTPKHINQHTIGEY